MRNKWLIVVLVSIGLIPVLPVLCVGDQQEDLLAKQLQIVTYLGMQCVKSSRQGQSLQSGGINGFSVDPASPTGKSLTELGFSLKALEISFFSPDEKGMTIRGSDKLVVPIPNEWRNPFTIRMEGNAQLPKVEFKGGEIVWDYGKNTVSFKNATFARVKGIEYQFLSGRWKRSPQK